MAGVRDVAVIVREDAPGQKQLAAYVVGDGPVTAVRQALRERLPGYMVPTAWAVVERLPLTPNGKVDRKALAVLKPAQDMRPVRTMEVPRSSLELEMIHIWRQILDVDDIGMEDNFFDLGGHSLKVVALRQMIRDEFGIDVPIAAFFSNPTPTALCEQILAKHGGINRSLVTLQKGTSELPPLFLIHEVSGGVLEYLDLCRELGPQFTIYGFVAPGYDSDEPPLRSVQSLASRYLAEMKRVAPEGPYHLLGWSFGGLVAFELAYELERAGESVVFLGLMDAHPFGEGTEDVLANRHDLHIHQMRERLDIPQHVVEGCTRDEAVQRMAAVLINRGVVPHQVASSVLQRQLGVMEAHTDAIEHYRPSGQVQADLVLFRAESSARHVEHAPWAR